MAGEQLFVRRMLIQHGHVPYHGMTALFIAALPVRRRRRPRKRTSQRCMH